MLQKGHVDPDKPTLVRMHVLSPFSDIFGETGPRSGVLGKAMDLIGEEGAGLVVLLNRHGINSLSNAVRMKSGETVPDMEELRDYGIGAQILTEMGVNEMELLTNSHHSLVALDGYGLSIVGERPIPMG